MTESDSTLWITLHNWRKQKAISVYGWAHFNDFGAAIIMPNAILDRIIDSAHHHKIQTVQDLKRETAGGWTDAEKFGDEVVGIVRAHAPTPFAASPLRPLTAAVTHPIGGSSTRKNKCSACNHEGHNGNVFLCLTSYLPVTVSCLARNCICPNHPSRSQAGTQNKENVRVLLVRYIQRMIC